MPASDVPGLESLAHELSERNRITRNLWRAVVAALAVLAATNITGIAIVSNNNAGTQERLDKAAKVNATQRDTIHTLTIHNQVDEQLFCVFRGAFASASQVSQALKDQLNRVPLDCGP